MFVQIDIQFYSPNDVFELGVLAVSANAGLIDGSRRRVRLYRKKFLDLPFSNDGSHETWAKHLRAEHPFLELCTF